MSTDCIEYKILDNSIVHLEDEDILIISGPINFTLSKPQPAWIILIIIFIIFFFNQ